MKHSRALVIVALCAIGPVIGAMGSQGADGQWGVQSGAAADPLFTPTSHPDLEALDVDELPLTEDGIVDDDGYMWEEEDLTPILVDEDRDTFQDDRPEPFLNDMLDG